LAAQGTRQYRLRSEPTGIDELLRSNDRAPGAVACLAAKVRADRAGRTHAAHELPDADAHLHDAFLWLGIRLVGAGRPGAATRAGFRNLLRDPGPAQRLLAAPLRLRTTRIRVAPPDLRPAGAQTGRRCSRLSPRAGAIRSATSAPASCLRHSPHGSRPFAIE